VDTTRPERSPEPLSASADSAAAASLRELPDALIVAFDEDMRFVLAATGTPERGAAGSSRAWEGRPLSQAFPKDLFASMEPLFRSALEGETRSREIWTADERHCLMVDVGPLPVGDGVQDGGREPAGGVAVVLDITQRRQADLIANAGRGTGFQEVFENAPIGTGLLDTDGRWLLVNRALCDITGYTAEELIGKRFEGIVHPDDVFNDAEQRSSLLHGQCAAYQVEKRYFDAAGETVAAILSVSLVREHDGSPLHYIAQLQDVSGRRRLEEHQRQLADHDPLTGLRNRRLFEHDLRLQVARSRRYGELAGVMMIEMDGMRALSARHGHAVGEETIRAVGRALSRRLRETDLVARLSDDEFAVLLPHIDREGISVVADGVARVLLACSVDVDVGDSVVHPTVSIAFTLIDERSESAEQVLAQAASELRATKLGG
jgi:diguanylate cyclase (GGDEF)-like protein/PAS domain S-box-containing protein